MKKVTDWADDLTYTGAMDFKDGADKAVEYAYDANGNMTRDRNKKIQSISYNILNLPSEVKFDDGHITRYTYDAAGTKLKAEYLLSNEQFMDWVMDGPAAETANVLSAGWNKGVDIGGIVAPSGSEIILKPVTQMTLQYSAGHVYRNGTLERVNNSFGYWADSSFHYNILDYQGNVRAVIAEDGTLEEVNNYYPYGGLMGAANAGVQPLKYGAKELDRENGLDLYDSKARFYDAMIGRTPTQDPLAEKYSCVSPYLWCAATPNRYRDPDGRKVELYATSLPGCDIPLATHTFIVIRDKNNNVREYFAFGSEYDGIKGSYSGRLKQATYRQDQMVINGNDTEHLKKIIEISPPSGMSESDFDNVVAGVAKSFGNNSGITYFLASSTADMTKGNCNTSTSTILLKSGVSKERIKSIAKEIPGISYGFSTSARPWTEHEQAEAVKSKQQADYLYNVVGKP